MHALVAVVKDAVLRFLKDDGWAIASHIALSILTSLFPFLIFVTALAGFFGTKNLADEAAILLLETWPQQVAAPIAVEIQNVLTQARGGLVTIGVVLALYFSSSAVEALRVGLNRAYDVVDERPWWLLRLESILFVFIGALALLAFSFLVVLAPLIWATILRYLPALARLEDAVFIARFGVASVVVLGMLVVMHKLLPAGRQRWRDITPGIVLTFLAWGVAGIAFGSYLAEFARNYVTTYAGLASVMIALVFLYTLATIFIFGGELNAAIRRRERRPHGQRKLGKTESGSSAA